MEKLEEVADSVMFDWQSRRLRLWLTPLRDRPEEFEHWAGLVRLRAEHFSNQWQPARPELVERLKECLEDPEEPPVPSEVLLPMAADAFEADLVAKGVPKNLARRARDLFTLNPPVAQWKMI